MIQCIVYLTFWLFPAAWGADRESELPQRQREHDKYDDAAAQESLEFPSLGGSRAFNSQPPPAMTGSIAAEAPMAPTVWREVVIRAHRAARPDQGRDRSGRLTGDDCQDKAGKAAALGGQYQCDRCHSHGGGESDRTSEARGAVIDAGKQRLSAVVVHAVSKLGERRDREAAGGVADQGCLPK